ncbi:hypothetical protein GCM10007898_33310 [Dyella flagellata]|uniref:Uncharacterized protein n=1 Tax=Dyella flagellata TaxID=1867833 RepID=A0ABQ5XDI6_9GAMM|nr:hypothetical protein GCM10007898_33310 [Dyella flagellata]
MRNLTLNETDLVSGADLTASPLAPSPELPKGPVGVLPPYHVEPPYTPVPPSGPVGATPPPKDTQPIIGPTPVGS